MKWLLLLTSIAIVSCNTPAVKTNETGADTASGPQAVDKSKFYTTLDTLVIVTEIGDTSRFSKHDFNEIVDNYPSLYSDDVRNPDVNYYCRDNFGAFNSEAGQDGYYMLYAYFLKQKNGVEKYATQRKKLIAIYLAINSLFQRFQYGGTYFGHQGLRILGYAEFSVYLYAHYAGHPEKTYSITKQKQLYINSLRQLIADEDKIDFETVGKEKAARVQELNKIVDDLDSLISDNFYLRRTQDFHYGHYEYY